MASNDVLVKIGADISDLTKKMGEVQESVSKASKKSEDSLGGLGGVVGKLGGVMAAAFSVKSIIDFGIQVAETGMAFENSMAKVQAISGATGDQMTVLGDYAREMGKKTVFSATESADALSYMALAGWDTQQMMDGLGGVLALASAGQLDLAFAADTVTDTLTMFGMEAEQSGRMVDVMASAQAKSNMNITQLSDAMKYAGTTAHTFGLDIEETSAALGVMANAGIKGSSAGSSLRSILSRLAAPTKAVTEGLSTLNVETKDLNTGSLRPLSDILVDAKKSMEGLTDAQQVQVAKQIAGQEAMGAFLAIVKESDGSLAELTGEMYNSAGAADEMATTMNDTLSGSLKLMGSAWDELKLQMYDFGSGAAKSVVDGITGIMTKFSELNNNGLEFSTGFGENVSTGVANALLPLQELNRGFQSNIEAIYFMGNVATPEMYSKMVTDLALWTGETNTMLADKYAADLLLLEGYFENNESLTDEEQAAMKEKLKGFYEGEYETHESAQAEIQRILEAGKRRNYEFTNVELERMAELQNRGYEHLLSLASTSADEELALLQASADDKGATTAAANEVAFANAKASREKILSEAKAQLDGEIKQAHRLKEVGVISETEYQAMVKSSKDNYGKIEEKANTSFKAVAKTVGDNTQAMGKTFNFETGKIMGGWENMCASIRGNVANFEAVYNIKTITTTETRTKGRSGAVGRGVPMPQMGRAMEVPSGMARMGGYSNDVSDSNSSLVVNMNGAVIREESDVRKIAQELYKIQQRNKRAKGVVAYV